MNLGSSVENGSLDDLKSLYENDNNIIKQLINEETIFYLACKYGHLDMARWIYSIDQDQIYIKSIRCCTSFYISCYYGYFDMAKWIYSIDPNQIKVSNNSNQTPFYVACLNGHIDIVKWIYSIDPDQIKIKNKNSFTPFHATCSNKRIDIAKWIYSIDPDQIKIENINGFTSFYASCYNGNFDIAKWIYSIDPDQLNIKNNVGFTSFYASCYNGHIDIAKWIYSIDSKQIKIRTNVGYTPLYTACLNGQLDVVKWIYSIDPEQIKIKINGLIAFHAGLTAFHTDLTAFHAAYCNKHLNVLQFLIDKDINILYDSFNYDDYDILYDLNIEYDVCEQIVKKGCVKFKEFMITYVFRKYNVDWNSKYNIFQNIKEKFGKCCNCPFCKTESYFNKIYDDELFHNSECKICFMNFNNNVYVSTCGHILCYNCLNQLVHNS